MCLFWEIENLFQKISFIFMCIEQVKYKSKTSFLESEVTNEPL